MIDQMAKAWLDSVERKNKAIMDLSVDLDRCKASLLAAVTERDKARAEVERLWAAMTFAVRWVDVFGNTPESGIDYLRRELGSD